MMKTMMMVWNSVGETRSETVYSVPDNITGFLR